MKKTPLNSWHHRHGAKMMEFGGYEMPIEYTSIIQEHQTVRDAAGLFDVSHMGEFVVEGADGGKFLDFLVTNWPSCLQDNQAMYSPMCYADGTTVDDLLIYRQNATEYMLVVNAANIEKDWNWIDQVRREFFPRLVLRNISDQIALLAIQGPNAVKILSQFTDYPLESIAYYHAVPHVVVVDTPMYLSRTGYTGEDGYELYVEADKAETVWDRLVEAGAKPVGLGARDTLRLEARLPLYGHELSDSISPLEAGLGMFVKFDKGDFVGRQALRDQKEAGLERKVVGLEVSGGIARAGYAVVNEQGESVGVVTSGSHSPTLKKAIALALLPLPQAKVGSHWGISVRGRTLSATVVKTPFYKRN